MVDANAPLLGGDWSAADVGAAAGCGGRRRGGEASKSFSGEALARRRRRGGDASPPCRCRRRRRGAPAHTTSFGSSFRFQRSPCLHFPEWPPMHRQKSSIHMQGFPLRTHEQGMGLPASPPQGCAPGCRHAAAQLEQGSSLDCQSKGDEEHGFLPGPARRGGIAAVRGFLPPPGRGRVARCACLQVPIVSASSAAQLHGC